MSCCDTDHSGTSARSDGRSGVTGLGRRRALARLAGLAGSGIAAASGLARAQGAKVRLAFCGQLLCVVPYEVTRARGHFRDAGIDIELVYTRGGSAAMQALVGGAVEYAGTSFDVALQAYANGAKIRRFASTGRLPLFALATSPKTASTIRSIADLQNRTIGVSGLGNADHVMMLYLLRQAGVDPRTVRFATLGPNLYDALRLGQVDAGMVQEPALSLITAAGGHTLVNAMDLDDAQRYLGGPYEFMGVTVRAAERESRLDEMRRLAAALAKGLVDTQTIPIEEVVAALPRELVVGGDRAQLVMILSRYRRSLYPDNVRIDVAASTRVLEANKIAGLIAPSTDITELMDLSVVGS